MIAYEPNEAQSFVFTDDIRPAVDLEAWTGADFIVSPLERPTHSKLWIAKHLQAGAFLIQRKEGEDLLSSLSSRLMESLLRMREFVGQVPDILGIPKSELKVRQSQLIVLYVGTLGLGADGICLVNGQPSYSGAKYFAVKGMLARFSERGGIVDDVPNRHAIATWLRMKENHARENAAGRTKEIYPSRPIYNIPLSTEPLQPMRRIEDGRVTLMTFPDMGVTRTRDLWEYANGNLFTAIQVLADPHTVKLSDRPKGIGIDTINKARTHLGLESEVLPIRSTVRDVVKHYPQMKTRKGNSKINGKKH